MPCPFKHIASLLLLSSCFMFVCLSLGTPSLSLLSVPLSSLLGQGLLSFFLKKFFFLFIFGHSDGLILLDLAFA
jgi:hypothetical protein